MFPIDKNKLEEVIQNLHITDITTATIRQICSLSDALEVEAADKCVHLEIGNPGFAATSCGVAAEIRALKEGIANKYPNIAGLPSLKENGSRFLKAFLDIDVYAKGIVPTVGSMQGTFTTLMILKQRMPGRDTVLFINPGFPATRNQAKILGIPTVDFDLYNYRGARLEEKLESILSKGNITGIVYSNPNNPAWTNLTQQELEIMGRMATKYDAIVVEDLAYLGMDFRQDMGKPFEPPYVPTVAKYTDNCILLVSASKIFSYAGQRISLVCMTKQVYERQYDFFRDFYEMPAFGDAYIFGVLYTASSGTAHSAQYAMAEMLGKACDGDLDFVANCREYGRRAAIAKRHFTGNGFHIVYAIDGDREIGDGFFFTVGYDDMTSEELQRELLRFGVSSISLPSTGSSQNGIRVCVSMLDSDSEMEKLGRRLAAFDADHKAGKRENKKEQLICDVL